MSFQPPSFRKSDRYGLAPQGELGGIEGTRGADQSQVRLIPHCASCSAILIERMGFVVCSVCRSIVHAYSPCSVMVDGRATCKACVHRTFPYNRELVLELAKEIIKPKKFNLAKKLGIRKQRLREIEGEAEAAGLLNKGKLTGQGLRVYYYLYQVFAFEPDIALLISEMEMAMDV